MSNDSDLYSDKTSASRGETERGDDAEKKGLFRVGVRYAKGLLRRILDKDDDRHTICVCTYVILGFISLGMTLLNLYGKKGVLTWTTGVFSFLCSLNLAITFSGKMGQKIAMGFFAPEVLAMFTFFLVTGNPDGFSAIWICALPSVGMMFYDRKKALVLCLAMFIILVTLLWVPMWVPGEFEILQYDYNTTFRIRFPLLFCAFCLLGYFLETLRANTHEELRGANAELKAISVRDQLTKAYNRKGLYDVMHRLCAESNFRKIGVIILDIDYFKTVNDTYGHTTGDLVLEDFAKLMDEKLDAIICRWGGEEFVGVYFDDRVKRADIEEFREALASHEFVYGDASFHITASAGVYETASNDDALFTEWVRKADDALYRAKDEGRNRVIYY